MRRRYEAKRRLLDAAATFPLCANRREGLAGLNWHLVLDWLKIVVLDLALAGDNAVVIGMAVRALPARQQRIGVCLGALGAVVARVVLTFAAARFLFVPYVQLAGGLLLIWIACKLLRQDGAGEPEIRRGATLPQAIRIIIVADLIMSTDNILAIADASEGSLFLVIFGLGLSIPIVVAGAALIAVLMSRFAWLGYLGAAILGEVAGKMILEDDFIADTLGAASKALEWEIRIGLAFVLFMTGFLLARRSVK